MNESQLMLALDTSTTALTVALLRGDEPLATAGMTAERNHSMYLLPTVQRLLQDSGVSATDLQAIGVGRGPGSYTGVRVAVTVAKTMAWALGIPLLGVSSLAAYAYGGQRKHTVAAHSDEAAATWFVPLLDARRGQAYTALYADVAGAWHVMEEDRIAPVAQWLEQLAEAFAASDAAKFVVLGDWAAYPESVRRLQEQCSDRLVLAEQPLAAHDIGRLARCRLLLGERDEWHPFVPNYAQLAEAEAKWQQRAEQEWGDRR